jgi:hypothetical protein
LCHYIHLNPARAKLCPTEALGEWPWTSLRWLLQPQQRPKWYEAQAFLTHAGELADSPAGRNKYLEYLAWLEADESARKAMQFERMSKGWLVGSQGFKAALCREHRQVAAALALGDREGNEIKETLRQEALDAALATAGKTRGELQDSAKMAGWKIELASALKAKTLVTNRWLAEHLHMGSLHEVSRRVAARQRETTKHKA